MRNYRCPRCKSLCTEAYCETCNRPANKIKTPDKHFLEKLARQEAFFARLDAEFSARMGVTR